jgi:hypothetical protein
MLNSAKKRACKCPKPSWRLRKSFFSFTINSLLLAYVRDKEPYQGYQLEKKEIPDDVSWIHSLPYPETKAVFVVRSRSGTQYLKKNTFNTSTSQKSEKFL